MIKRVLWLYSFLCYSVLHGSACTPLVNSAGTNIWEIADTVQALLAEQRTHVITAIPFTISAAGIYVLGDNIVDTSTTNGITIAADDVIIDLRGKTISKNLSAPPRAIFTTSGTRKNITIKNGTLIASPNGSGFPSRHIDASNITGLTIQNITFKGRSNSTSATSVMLDSSIGILFENCIFVKNFNSLLLTDCEHVTLRQCDVLDSGADGFQFTGGRNFSCFECALYSEGMGFAAGSSAQNIVYNCCLSSSCTVGLEGFAADSCANIIIEDCVANDNGTEGFDYSGSEKTIYFNCAATNNILSGFLGGTIAISCQANNNTGAGFSGVNILVNSSADNNTSGNYTSIIPPTITSATIDNGTFWHNLSS